MMAALARLARDVFGLPQTPPPPATFDRAMRESESLILQMRAEVMQRAAQDTHPIRAMMADLWLQRHNVPFLTTVHETIAEMKSATQYASEVARDLKE